MKRSPWHGGVIAGHTPPQRADNVVGERLPIRADVQRWKGYPRDLAERALAHAVQNKVEAAYHRTDLLEQRRPLMQAWADFVAPAKRLRRRNKT